MINSALLEELNKIAYEFLLRAYMINGIITPNPKLKDYSIEYKKRHTLSDGIEDKAYMAIVGDETQYFEYYLDGRYVKTTIDDDGKVLRSEMNGAIVDFEDLNDIRSAYPILRRVEKLGIDIHAIYVEIPQVPNRDDLRLIREYEVADCGYFGNLNEYFIRLNIKR